MLINVVAHILAFVVVAPVFALYLLYIAQAKWTKRPFQSLKRACDQSVLLFIFSTYMIVRQQLDVDIIWYMIILFLITAILFLIFQWNDSDDVTLGKVIKQVWRTHFIIYLLAYFSLVLYSLIAFIVF